MGKAEVVVCPSADEAEKGFTGYSTDAGVFFETLSTRRESLGQGSGTETPPLGSKGKGHFFAHV